MFFEHKHLLEELREKGRHATAEIISLQTEGGGNSMRANWAPDDDLTTAWTDCKMDLRVSPPGESPFEATVHTRLHTFKWKGDKVPVWYDPDNHHRVVVDYEEDVATQTRAVNDAALSQHRDDLRPGLVWTPIGHAILPLEAIARPGRGRLKHTGRLAAMLTEQAQAALAYLRDNATELMPHVGADWLATNDVHLDQPYGTAPADLDAEVVAGAGLAVAVAIASLMAARSLGRGTVVTGALTPGGELAPVPRVVEKILAADRIQARRIIVPEGDRGRWQDHPTTKVLKTKVVFVGSIAEALRATV
jgi:ATP-dependent Lon protease